MLCYESLLLNATVLIPLPTGPYGTSFSVHELVDKSRQDPFAPTPETRALVVSAWYPVPKETCHDICLVPYMPTATARYEEQFTLAGLNMTNGTLETVKLGVCCGRSVEFFYKSNTIPVVLFSTGLGTSRHQNNAQVQQLASEGYAVISIDHTYDAAYVEFPDGRGVAGVIPDDSTFEKIELAVATRIQDFSFVLDQLSVRSTLEKLFPFPSDVLNVARIPILGWSIGGASAIAAAQNETRIAGAANLDGAFFLIKHEIKTPIFLFGAQGHNTSQPITGQYPDDSWPNAWPYFRGLKVELSLLKGAHSLFSDIPILVKVLSIFDRLTPHYKDAFKGIEGARVLEITVTYLKAFVDFAVYGRDQPLLEKNSTAFPEVVVLHSLHSG